MDKTAISVLEPLSQVDLTLRDQADDIRGFTVRDRKGEILGAIDELLVDQAERRVRFVRVVAGGFLGLGEDKFLIPVDAITHVGARDVWIDQPRQRVPEGPKYDPSLARDVGYLETIFEHYGHPPYWAPGYVYPHFRSPRDEYDVRGKAPVGRISGPERR